MHGTESAPDERSLTDPSLYLNRELSWLAFNKRVLALAQRPDVPVMERLKFLAIASSNLDEFYMVRIGGLERQVHRDSPSSSGPDGRTPAEVLAEATAEARQLSLEIAHTFASEVGPELVHHGIRIGDPGDLERLRDAAVAHYHREVHPCLTPIAIDHAHPFPILKSGSLNLAFRIRRDGGDPGPFDAPEGELLAVVQVPSVLPRFVRLEPDSLTFVAMEALIGACADALFPGHTILEARPFRLTRASDLDIAEDEAEDLLSTIEDELRRRDRGDPVRLEVAHGASPHLQERLRTMLELEPRQLIEAPSLVNLADLWAIVRQVDLPQLKDPPFVPQPVERLRYAPTIFRSIEEGDVLLHHPYDSFRHVVDFIEQAATDPDVVAIKQTLYRTSGDSPIVRALARAAEAGKEVTALVELKARFDEANNIAWARALEQSGVHVVYGLIGLKTHCKILLVTRREGRKLRRYLHLGTGNYNPTTAKLYTDLGLFTAAEAITHDAMLLFNVLTGYAELSTLRHLVVAPFDLRRHVLHRIDQEIEHARSGRPAGFVAQMNSLVDPEVIEHLYRASRAGVRIDLLVRGICCLRPQVPGVSENIRVRSILDRFLEHSRIFWWRNGGDDLVYSGSADWMPRNLNRRIEVVFPILDPEAKRRVMHDVLGTAFRDNTFSWELQSDGNYVRRSPGDAAPVRAQQVFVERVNGRGKTSRTTLRPEVPVKRFTSPAARVAEAQRRRSGGDIDNDTFIEKKKS